MHADHVEADYSGPANLPASASHVLDPRLQLLTTLVPDLFLGRKCLDIGCNAGGVSCQLGKSGMTPVAHCKRI
jgi:7SK snRNA methylphosphate capping enzyme